MSKINNIFSVLTLGLTFISVNQWSSLAIGNLWTTWFLQILFIAMLIKYRHYLCPFSGYSKILQLYLVWLVANIIRGVFVAENYLEWKQLIGNSIPLAIPLFMWLFCKPSVTLNIYRVWFHYGMLAFIFFFFWIIGISQFYLSPLLLLFCFWPLYNKKTRWILVVGGLIYMFGIESARSQTIKGGIALLVGISSMIVYKINPKWLKIGHAVGYLCTIFLFIVVLTDATGLILGKISEDNAIENNMYRTDIAKDTRSLIFYDVYRSSVNNKYWLWGHTPARGNEIGMSWVLYRNMYETIKFNKNERYKNEMLHLNIYTWLGLIGLILYSSIYFRASYLAVYRSNNRYISLLGCFVAFRWSFGWVEDTNNFSISDIALWTMIGMCVSPYFRNMDKRQFEDWIRLLLRFRKRNV